MSEALHINPESFEDEQEHDSEIMELAVGGLSHFVSEQDDGTDDGSGYEEDDYNDDYDEEDDCGDIITIANMKSNIMVGNALVGGAVPQSVWICPLRSKG